jgi:hypothetical protein
MDRLIRARSLSDALHAKSETLARREGERDAAKARLAEAETSLHAVIEMRDRAGNVHATLQVAADALREKMKVRLEDVATRALRFVFERDYKVSFDVKTRHGQLTATCVVSEGGVSAAAMGGHGGGVLDVLALVLRAAVLRSTDGRQVLVCDEPLKFLNSPDALERMKRLLTELSKRDLQIILVSSRGDTRDMEGARVFEFEPHSDGAVVNDVS